jgi:hypothetical protein
MKKMNPVVHLKFLQKTKTAWSNFTKLFLAGMQTS